MGTVSKQDVWMFQFALEREDGAQMTTDLPEALLKAIVQWAEENGCQVGGGYSAPVESDAGQPLFSEDENNNLR